MTEKSIETRIREHYTAQNGEWLIESGKVKEAKLLKEYTWRVLKGDVRVTESQDSPF
jgi:hypothetical protein